MSNPLVEAFRLAARGRRVQVALAAVCGVAAAGLAVVQPVLFGSTVDALVGGKGLDGVAPVLGAFVTAALGFVAIDFVNKLLSDSIAHHGLNDAMTAFVEAVMRQSQDWHGNVHSAWLMKTMTTGSDAMFQLWLGGLRSTLPNVATLLVMIPTTLMLDWRLGALFMVLVVFFSWVSSGVVRRAMRAQEEVEEVRGRISAQAGDDFANIKLIQAYNREEDEIAALRGLLEERLRKQKPVLRLWAAFTSLPDSAFALTFAGIFGAGAAMVSAGEATVGEVVTFVTLASGMVPRIGGLQIQISEILWRTAQMKDFLDVLAKRPAIADPLEPVRPERIEGRVRFENVTFRYPNGGAGVEGVALDVAPGECVALVGHTGAGKTTVANLLLRFADPQEGRITIDGVDIASMPLDLLREHVGVVFQDAHMLNRTVGENLRLGNPRASDEAIRDAVRRAHAEVFILRSPEGYATAVGERGQKLSGGERQRLSIARAILKDAPIMILDEATSALDAQTERLIQQSLEGLMAGRTSFVIAHRLSTVMKADRIVVMDHGRIVESGTFADLVAAGGRFAKLVEAQTLAVPA